MLLHVLGSLMQPIKLDVQVYSVCVIGYAGILFFLASPTQTRGVLYYVDDMNDILELERNAPHAPYIVLMEPQFFRG